MSKFRLSVMIILVSSFVFSMVYETYTNLNNTSKVKNNVKQ